MVARYQVIARRWRPKQFDELVGQEPIVRTLKNAIQSKRIAHAYLFVGPRGTGKTTTARIFAKALNAEGGPNSTPDDSTEIARAIMDGSCMDVIEIDGASNNSVDDIRSLREDCQYAPAQCSFRIYIIDEVHMLSNNAWNALLKTLEEPPAHVIFIFATTEAHKVPATVVSRCQRFEFRPIPDDKIVIKLSEIADADQVTIDAPALNSVARMADGGMRDAQSILDQLISFCGSQITEADVLDVYGLASESTLEAFAGALAAAHYQQLFALIEQIVDEGRDLYRVLQDIQAKLRSYLVQAIQNGGQVTIQEIILSAEALTRMLEALQASESAVRQGLSQRVNFEVALLRAIDQSRTRAIDSVIKQLTTLAAQLPEEMDLGQALPSTTATPLTAAPTKNPIRPEAPSEPAPSTTKAADPAPAEPSQAPNTPKTPLPKNAPASTEKAFPGSETFEEAKKKIPAETQKQLSELLRADFKYLEAAPLFDKEGNNSPNPTEGVSGE